MLNRKKFLKISGGTAASLLMSSSLSKVFAESEFKGSIYGPDDRSPASLLPLKATPPEGTTAVRFFIDDMLVSELTDLYATKVNVKPMWSTVTDPAWFQEGPHELRIEADTKDGTKTLENKTIQGTQKQDPKKISLTGAWQFAEMSGLPANALEGDVPEAVKPGYNDGEWTKIFVPNSLGAVNKKWNVYEGILGIYKKIINLPIKNIEDELFIVLQSCYWSGRVFINGKEVGNTRGGYLPSRFDISKQTKNGENEIAIIVDNRFSSMGVFKRINEFYWNWGGLLQEVHIERHPSVSLTDLRAEGAMNGTLQLYATGLNATRSLKIKNLGVEIYHTSTGKIAASFKINANLPPGENVIKLPALKIQHPTLWNPESPHLYTVVIKGDFGVLKVRTGFRDVKVTGRDILINGKVIENLQGFDRHADYPGLGRTQPDRLPFEELKELRDKGFRFFRPAHYPTTPAQLDAADELGLLVIEEINVTGLKGNVLASKEVKDFAAMQLTKMIHRDRSHPSIIGWSVGNENFTEQDGAAEYVRDTIKVGRSLDTRRLFTQVTHRHTTDTTFEYQDFVAQNYYAGWYTKDVNVIANLIESVQAYAGNKPIMLSEYGAEAIVDKPGTAKSTEFYQGFIVDAHNRLLDNRKHFFGKMYWSSSEFWCRPSWTGGSPDPRPPFHLKGLISYDRAHKKLGWRAIFSPVRLIFNPHTVKTNDVGGDFEMPLDKETTIIQVITVKEIRNIGAKGTLLLELPKAFSSDKLEYPFQLKAGEDKSIRLVFTGTLASENATAEVFIKAVIDGDTEAQPLLLTLKKAEEKKSK